MDDGVEVEAGRFRRPELGCALRESEEECELICGSVVDAAARGSELRREAGDEALGGLNRVLQPLLHEDVRAECGSGGRREGQLAGDGGPLAALPGSTRVDARIARSPIAPRVDADVRRSRLGSPVM